MSNGDWTDPRVRQRWAERRKRVLGMRKQGLSMSMIADALGVSKQRVHQILGHKVFGTTRARKREKNA